MKSACMKSLARPDWNLIAAGWALVNFFLFQEYGVKVVNDSRMYLYLAEGVRDSGPGFVNDHYRWYFTYILLIAGVQGLGGSYGSIVLVQVLLSGLSLVFLYKATRLVSSGRYTPLLAVLMYLFWIKVSMWNMYLLTESIHLSLLIMTFYWLLRLRASRDALIPFMLSFMLFFFTRPSAVIFLAAAAGMVVVTAWGKPWPGKRYLKPAGIAGVLLLALLINRMLDTFLLLENYARGELVYGISTFETYRYRDLLTLEVPAGLHLPEHGGALMNILSFIVHNPLFFAKLFLGKLLLLLVHAKPYNSLLHNVLIACTLYPLYFFATLGLGRIGGKALQVFFIAFFAGTMLMVALTVEDWDGRFLMPVMPFLCILGAEGFRRVGGAIGLSEIKPLAGNGVHGGAEQA
jgi:hypothetical protein